MQKSIVLIIGVLLMALLAGCQTGDTASDPAAAQSFVPATLPGYNVTAATDILAELEKVGVGASVVTGNVPLAAAIAKLEGMISCYRNVGAIEARLYTEAKPNTIIPKIGVLAVINTTRLQRNLLSCAVSLGTDGVGAQAVGEIQLCASSGSKEVNGESLQYIYAATSPELCATFQQPFN